MITKEELGTKIRALREAIPYTREQFCEDETHLTVKQLARIEHGKSLPTLTTLEFIATRLERKVAQLIDEKQLILSEDYLVLKQELTRLEHYGDAKRLTEYEQKLAFVYEHYFEQLPEEEQLVIEVFQSNIDIFETQNTVFGEAVLQEYFDYLQRKKIYRGNDFYVLHLYFLSIGCKKITKKDQKIFLECMNKLLTHQDEWKHNFIEVINCICHAVNVYALIDKIDDALELIDLTLFLMTQWGELYRKCVLLFMKARIYKLSGRSMDEVAKSYRQAVNGALFLEDRVLYTHLKESMEKDLHGKKGT